MSRLLLSFLLLFITTACSQRKGVPVNIKIKEVRGLASLSTEYAGGLYVYGYSGDGKSFARAIDGSASSSGFSVNLPNGSWTVYAVAWDNVNTNGNLTGKVRCGTSSINLTGNPADLNLSISNGGCSGTTFSPTMNDDGGNPLVYNFPEIKINSCLGQVSAADIASNPSFEDDICDNPSLGQGMDKRGHFGSMKFVLRSFDNMGSYNDLGSNLMSVCKTVQSPSAQDATFYFPDPFLNLPIGGSAPFPVELRAYYGSTTCDDANVAGFKTFQFEKLNDPSTPFRPYLRAAGFETLSLFLTSSDAEICSGARASFTGANFSGGDGTSAFPYVICNKSQFNSIGGSYISGTNYRLAANLDYQMNFADPLVSIGGVSGSAVTFDGNFFGNGHAISNAVIDCSNCTANYAGIIRDASTGFINNLTIDGIHIDSPNVSAGGLVGYSSSNNLHNIIIKNARVFSPMNTGGLAGYASSSNISNVHVDGYLEGGASVGGLIGQYDSGTGTIINQASFFGTIRAEDQAGPDGHAGGIIGTLGSGSSRTISEVRVDGFVHGLISAGGVVGDGSMGSFTIDNSYVLARIKSKSFNGCTAQSCGNAGGFVGLSGSTVFVSNSFKTLGGISSEMPNIGSVWGSGTAVSEVDVIKTGIFQSGTTSGSPITGSAIFLNPTQVLTNSNFTNFTISSDSTTTAAIWFKASGDDTYDYPRLFWELDLENELPQLSRNCSGIWSQGTGTSLDPIIVHSASQIQSLSASNYYLLCRDIDFTGVALTGGLSFPDGVELDGNGYGIYNSTVSIPACSSAGDENLGLFKTIGTSPSSTAKLTNIGIFDSKFEQPPIATDPFVNNCQNGINLGLVAGINKGTIDDVMVDGFKLNMQIDFPSGGGPKANPITVHAGGVVGINSGFINKTYIDGNIKSSTNYSTFMNGGMDSLKLGGIAGKNDSGKTIQLTGGHLSFDYRIDMVSQGVFDSTSVGGATGTNYGTLSKVDVESNMMLTNTQSAVASNFNVGGLVGFSNAGTILQSKAYGGNYISSNFNSVKLGGLVGGTMNNSTISESIFEESDYGTNAISGAAITLGGIVADVTSPAAITINDSFCVSSATVFGYGGFSAYPNSGQVTTSDPDKCAYSGDVNYAYNDTTDTLTVTSATASYNSGFIFSTLTRDYVSSSDSFTWFFEDQDQDWNSSYAPSILYIDKY